MNPKGRQELIGVGAFVVGVFLGLTLLPWRITGGVGEGIGTFLWAAFGLGAVVIPLMGLGWALAAFERLGTLSTLRAAALGAGLIVLLPYTLGILGGAGDLDQFPADHAEWSAGQLLVGIIPGWIAGGVRHAVGTAGGVLAGLFALSALGIGTIGWHPLVVLRSRERGNGKGEGGRTREKREPPRAAVVPFEEDEEPASEQEPGEPLSAPRSPKPRKPKPSPPPPPIPEGALIPPIDLLTEPPPGIGDADAEAIDEMGRRLVATLDTFRVGGQIADKTVGPVVTRFELSPGPGVKVGRIAALADDLALAMKAQSLRIVAPIPGKAAVGIEVPNPTPRIVHLRELIDTNEFRRPGRVLPVALGRNLEGEEVVDDLAKMPHLLIAGATGSGKSVCINTIITSLVYAHPPEKLKFLMIDPKMVEL